jgi:hypothetical protein
MFIDDDYFVDSYRIRYPLIKDKVLQRVQKYRERGFLCNELIENNVIDNNVYIRHQEMRAYSSDEED